MRVVGNEVHRLRTWVGVILYSARCDSGWKLLPIACPSCEFVDFPSKIGPEFVVMLYEHCFPQGFKGKRKCYLWEFAEIATWFQRRITIFGLNLCVRVRLVLCILGATKSTITHQTVSSARTTWCVVVVVVVIRQPTDINRYTLWWWYLRNVSKLLTDRWTWKNNGGKDNTCRVKLYTIRISKSVYPINVCFWG